jgi:hypothetical protein
MRSRLSCWQKRTQPRPRLLPRRAKRARREQGREWQAARQRLWRQLPVARARVVRRPRLLPRGLPPLLLRSLPQPPQLATLPLLCGPLLPLARLPLLCRRLLPLDRLPLLRSPVLPPPSPLGRLPLLRSPALALPSLLDGLLLLRRPLLALPSQLACLRLLCIPVRALRRGLLSLGLSPLSDGPSLLLDGLLLLLLLLCTLPLLPQQGPVHQAHAGICRWARPGIQLRRRRRR